MKKYLFTISLVILSVLLFTTCDGFASLPDEIEERDNSNDPESIEYIGEFSIESINLQDSTLVLNPSLSIVITFSRELDEDTIDSDSFSLMQGIYLIPLTFSYDNALKQVTCTPANHLDYDTNYTFIVHTDLQDTLQSVLEEDSQYSFSTSIFSYTITPADNTTGIVPPDSFTVEFTESINTATFDSTTAPITADSTPLAGTYQFSNSDKIVEFVPTDGFKYGVDYELTLTTDIEDIYEIALPSETTSGFGTKNLVSSITPADSSTEVDLFSTIDVVFEEAIDPATVTSSAFEVNDGSEPIPGEITFSEGNTQAQFTPDFSLKFNKTYTVTVTDGVTDTGGKSEGSSSSNTFETPDINVSVYPSPYTGLSSSDFQIAYHSSNHVFIADYTNGITSVNISNYATGLTLGENEGGGFSDWNVQGVAVDDTYVYFSYDDADAESGIGKASKTALTSGEVDSYDLGEDGWLHNRIALYEDTLFACYDDNASDGGVRIIDKSTMNLVGYYQRTYAKDVCADGKWAYIATGQDNPGIVIINYTDPGNITEYYESGSIGDMPYTSSASPVAIEKQEDYLYVAATSYFYIFDVSDPDPASWEIAASYEVPAGTASALDVAVSGAYAYVAMGTDGMVVFDITGADSSSPIDLASHVAGSATTIGAKTLTLAGDLVIVENGANIYAIGIY